MYAKYGSKLWGYTMNNTQETVRPGVLCSSRGDRLAPKYIVSQGFKTA